MSKYKHEEDVHNLISPNIIAPKIIELLKPKSVVDVGCGLGTFLNAFKRYGVSDVLGIDGPWTNKDLLHNYIPSEEFLEWDLEKEITLNKKFDLVICLEVAEHLSPESADTFVKSLVNCGNIILFSAAIPNQGGQNHLNEQFLTYWEEKFLKYDFVIYDILRPIFWDIKDIFWWYKQNMVLVAPQGLKFHTDVKYVPMRNIIHYEMFAHTNLHLNNKTTMLNYTTNKLNTTTNKLNITTNKLNITTNKLNITTNKLNITTNKLNITRSKLNDTIKLLNKETNHLNSIYTGKERKLQYLKWFLKSIIGIKTLMFLKGKLKFLRSKNKYLS